MALNRLGLGLIFSGVDLLTGPMIRMRQGFGLLGLKSQETAAVMSTAFVGMGLGIAGVLASFALLKGSFSLAKESADVELELRRVGLAMTRGKTDSKDAEEQLRSMARTLAQDLAVPIDDSIKGFQAFARAGIRTTGEMKEMLEPAAKLSAASFNQLSVEQSANLALQSRFAFGVKDTNKALNMLAAVTLQGRTEFRELPDMIGKITRGATKMGVPMERAILTFGLVRNVLNSSTEAGTNVSRMMERMTSSAKLSRLWVQKTGSAIYDASGNTRDYVDILSDALPALAKATDKQRSEWMGVQFGTKASTGLTAILNQLVGVYEGMPNQIDLARQKLRALSDEITRGDDIIGLFAKEQLEPMSGQIKQLGARWKDFRTEVGRSFQTEWDGTIRAINEGMLRITKAWDKLPESTKTATASFVIQTGVVAGLAGTFLLVSGAAILFKLAISKAAVPFVNFVRFVPKVLGPLGLATGLFIAAKENIGGFGDALRSSWEDLKSAFSSLLTIAANLGAGFFEGLRVGLESLAFAFRGLGFVINGITSIVSSVLGVFADSDSSMRTLGWVVGVLTGAFLALKTATLGYKLVLAIVIPLQKLWAFWQSDSVLRIRQMSLVEAKSIAVKNLDAYATSRVAASHSVLARSVHHAMTRMGQAGLMGSLARLSATLLGPVGLIVAIGGLAAAFGGMAGGMDKAVESGEDLIDIGKRLRIDAIKTAFVRERAEKIAQKISRLEGELMDFQERAQRGPGFWETMKYEFMGPVFGTRAREAERQRVEAEIAARRAALGAQYTQLGGLREKDVEEQVFTAAVERRREEMRGGETTDPVVKRALNLLEKIEKHTQNPRPVNMDGERVSSTTDEAARRNRDSASIAQPEEE